MHAREKIPRERNKLRTAYFLSELSFAVNTYTTNPVGMGGGRNLPLTQTKTRRMENRNDGHFGDQRLKRYSPSFQLSSPNLPWRGDNSWRRFCHQPIAKATPHTRGVRKKGENAKLSQPTRSTGGLLFCGTHTTGTLPNVAVVRFLIGIFVFLCMCECVVAYSKWLSARIFGCLFGTVLRHHELRRCHVPTLFAVFPVPPAVAGSGVHRAGGTFDPRTLASHSWLQGKFWFLFSAWLEVIKTKNNTLQAISLRSLNLQWIYEMF